MDINVFTASMRTEFNNAWGAIDTSPAPWQNFTTRVPSTARIENYTHMTPSPGIAAYVGHRRLASLGGIKYTVQNQEYDGSFSVLTRDIEDDQGIAGYKTKPPELAKNAHEFPGRLALSLLANGTSSTLGICFDGSAFFADSHNFGTGDNKIAQDNAGNDGVSHVAVLLYHGGPLKPLIYQERKTPDFQDDYVEKTSKFNKQVNFWVDMEGAAAFGYWWDATYIAITDTPTVTECQTILAALANQFRTYALPKSLPEDPTVYVHEQTVFNTANATLVVSSKLGELFRQVLTQPTIVNSGAAVTNIYNGFANLAVTNYLG